MKMIDRLPMKASALKPALPPAFDTKTHEYAGFIIREWKHASFEDGRITTRYDTAYEIQE